MFHKKQNYIETKIINPKAFTTVRQTSQTRKLPVFLDVFESIAYKESMTPEQFNDAISDLEQNRLPFRFVAYANPKNMLGFKAFEEANKDLISRLIQEGKYVRAHELFENDSNESNREKFKKDSATCDNIWQGKDQSKFKHIKDQEASKFLDRGNNKELFSYDESIKHIEDEAKHLLMFATPKGQEVKILHIQFCRKTTELMTELRDHLEDYDHAAKSLEHIRWHMKDQKLQHKLSNDPVNDPTSDLNPKSTNKEEPHTAIPRVDSPTSTGMEEESTDSSMTSDGSSYSSEEEEKLEEEYRVKVNNTKMDLLLQAMERPTIPVARIKETFNVLFDEDIKAEVINKNKRSSSPPKSPELNKPAIKIGSPPKKNGFNTGTYPKMFDNNKPNGKNPIPGELVSDNNAQVKNGRSRSNSR